MLQFVLELVKLLPSVLPLVISLFKRKPEPEPTEPPVIVEPPIVVEPPIEDEPEPVDPTNKNLYLDLDRAEYLVREELNIKLQANAWGGWRDPEYVARFCPDMAPLPSADELREFAKIGFELDQEGNTLGYRMIKEHPKYKGKSVVRKLVWAEFITRLNDHLDKVSEYVSLLKKEPGNGSAYNSMKGWCEYKRKQG